MLLLALLSATKKNKKDKSPTMSSQTESCLPSACRTLLLDLVY